MNAKSKTAAAERDSRCLQQRNPVGRAYIFVVCLPLQGEANQEIGKLDFVQVTGNMLAVVSRDLWLALSQGTACGKPGRPCLVGRPTKVWHEMCKAPPPY